MFRPKATGLSRIRLIRSRRRMTRSWSWKERGGRSSMIHNLRITSVAIFGVALLGEAEEPPAWLRGAVALATPPSARQAPAIVLRNEQVVTLLESGRTEILTRSAVRVLSRNGRNAAVACLPYLPGAAKIRDFRAWIVRPSGAVQSYARSHILDVALAQDDIYHEARAKELDASADAEPGSVFGYEAEVE